MYARLSSNSQIDYPLLTLPVPDLPASPDSRSTPKPSVLFGESPLWSRFQASWSSASPRPSVCLLLLLLPSWLPTRFWTCYYYDHVFCLFPDGTAAPIQVSVCLLVLPPSHNHLFPVPTSPVWRPVDHIPLTSELSIHLLFHATLSKNFN